MAQNLSGLRRGNRVGTVFCGLVSSRFDGFAGLLVVIVIIGVALLIAF
jgi:tetrahydromethanopterin S-methyltransferase subunit F